MTDLLLVGDPHAVPDELADCEALARLVADLASKLDATVVLMGDQHHTHSILRLEVLHFWRKWLPEFGRVVMLKGNHDCFVEPGRQGSALDAYADLSNVTLVADGPIFQDGVAYVPYCHTQEEFLRMCGEHPGAGTLVCHQTFVGAAYENGFYAPDGFDLSLVPQSGVWSGHIHTPQVVGKCRYVGAPRWRSANDANVERAVWHVRVDAVGRILEQTPYDTGAACRQIRSVVLTPDVLPPTYMDPRHVWHVDLVGPAEWVDATKPFYQAFGVRLRTRKTDSSPARVKESEGVDQAFARYADVYRPKHGTDLIKLREYAKARLAA